MHELSGHESQKQQASMAAALTQAHYSLSKAHMLGLLNSMLQMQKPKLRPVKYLARKLNRGCPEI